MPIRVATPDAIATAARILRDGGLVAFPTETVYGLGADATNGRAIAALYALKGRPSFNPLIVHLADSTEALRCGRPTEMAERLARAFWPGPLTLVLACDPAASIASLTLAGLDTIALRVPAHPVALALLRETGRPIAAPSANRSGRISPTCAAHVAASFSVDAPLILDGGDTRVGVESTIVDVTGSEAMLLRPGGVTRAEIERVLGVPLTMPSAIASAERPAVTAPGQLASHYAPRAAVRLDAREVRPGEALLAFGAPLPHEGPMLNLSLAGDLAEAAANLFAFLHALDASGAKTIAVMEIPRSGLGEAIADRLGRAAAPRSSLLVDDAAEFARRRPNTGGVVVGPPFRLQPASSKASARPRHQTAQPKASSRCAWS